MFQTTIALFIVALAGILLWRRMTKKGGSCGGCGTCAKPKSAFKSTTAIKLSLVDRETKVR